MEEGNGYENATITGVNFCITEFDYSWLNKHAQLLKEVVPLLFLCDKTKTRVSWKKILRYIHMALIP